MAVLQDQKVTMKHRYSSSRCIPLRWRKARLPASRWLCQAGRRRGWRGSTTASTWSKEDRRTSRWSTRRTVCVTRCVLAKCLQMMLATSASLPRMTLVQSPHPHVLQSDVSFIIIYQLRENLTTSSSSLCLYSTAPYLMPCSSCAPRILIYNFIHLLAEWK